MNVKNILAEKIAGEITLSPKPGSTIRKWRSIFEISQTELANYLKVSPSVISDYESGRRESPGIKTIRRLIEAFFDIDERRGGKIINKYTSMIESPKGVIEIMEYPYSIPAREFIESIKGEILTCNEVVDKKLIRGFTLIDSISAIKTLSSTDYVRIYGWSTERALIFTGITYGRSPMIAVRVHPMKPSVVVYHKPSAVDSLASKLSEYENIPLVVTHLSLESLKNILENLASKK
jgi:putative transcriptional regulator